MERAEAAVTEAERIASDLLARRPFADGTSAPEVVHAATDRLAALAESGGTALRDRLRAMKPEATEARSKARIPHGVVVALRTLGMAWAALMLATLTVAFATRSSARRATAATEPDANEIRIRTALGPMAFTSRATAFRGGMIDCWYGGGFVDLREATLDPAGAALRVRAVFGGGQIVVPATWRVTSHVRGIGGLTDVRPAAADLPLDAPHLTIDGMALFGGFAVQSELPEAQKSAMEEAVGKAFRDLPEMEAVPGV
jgi:hypothetical protein